MGNSRSQPCRRSRPMYLFYLIQRTWTGKSASIDKEDGDEIGDRESSGFSSSRCCSSSDCKSSSCHYRQDSLTFDSESEMAPNAEEELLAVKPWGPQPEKERLRPPTYNAEDYAIALRRWGRRPVVTSHESHGTLPSTTSSSSGYASGCGEMTLRQFTSVSELLNKLRADLRLAFPSFVQEFASPPADGITLLLETLRGVQLIQSSPPSGQGGPRIGTRRAALDELGCVECLAACGERCPDAPRLLSKAQPGLLALAVCLTSSLNRSRVLALQLLTKVCQAPGGHLAVSEAVSTLRLRYGEGGRFRFLAGALLAPRAAMALRVAGISFLNAFLKSASRTQTRLYIQAEACEAGLEPKVLQSWLTEVDIRSDDTLTDLLHKEVQKWSNNCVDVEALQKRLAHAEETCITLVNKVTILQQQLEACNNEKICTYVNNEQNRNIKLTSTNVTSSENRNKIVQQAISSNAEDEGISSSERSSSPEDNDDSHVSTNGHVNIENIAIIDNDQETTIDDVIEELRIIVKDAEEEYEDRRVKCPNDYTEITRDIVTSSNNEKNFPTSRISVKSENLVTMRSNETAICNDTVTYFGRNDDDEASVDSAITRKLSSSSSLRMMKNSNDSTVKIIVKSTDFEDAIVPAILYPQPPRRSPPCLSTLITTRETDFLDNPIVYVNQNEHEIQDQHEEEEEEEIETLGDGSDSLLSASRLKYMTKNEDNEFPDISTNLKVQNFYKNQLSPRDNDESRKINNSTNTKVSTTFHDESRTIRNFDDNPNIKNHRNSISTTNYHDVYEQFETTSKRLKDNLIVQSNGKLRYNDMEKKKKVSLRRSTSQDFLDSNDSNSGKSRIEGRIRKFESMNAFENLNLKHFTRFNEINNDNEKITRFGDCGMRIKRSESFHHVSMAEREESSSLTRGVRVDGGGGGSDSGLVYVTDYDLVPMFDRKNIRDVLPKFANLSTKSLDRIDESLDTIQHDEKIFKAKRPQTTHFSSKDKNEKSMKNRKDEKLLSSKVKTCVLKNSTKKPRTDKTRKNDDVFHDLTRGNSKLLRNDELYDDNTRNGKQWNFQNDVDDYKRITNFTDNHVKTNDIKKQCINGNEKFYNKFSNNDTGIFLPSGRYDAFGLGKNRFNAGKYSGNTQLKRDDNVVGVRRNSTASLVSKRGKVTDILSGLY